MAKNVNKANKPANPQGHAAAGPKKPSRRRWLLGAGAVALGGAGVYWAATGGSQTREYSYEIVNRYPHDRDAFTQGLIYHEDDILYEGTGDYENSRLRKVRLQTGEVLHEVTLPSRHTFGSGPPRELFGEGITLWNDRIIQLTWEHNVAFVYDRADLREVNRFTYTGEGWGLTHDGQHLIMSDGTTKLTFRDPNTFAVVREIVVRDGGHEVRHLNELEYIDGEIYANVWHQDRIARISPATGDVVAWLNLAGLRPIPAPRHAEAVLNGIAHDAQEHRLFVTGKHWSELFEIRQVAR